MSSKTAKALIVTGAAIVVGTLGYIINKARNSPQQANENKNENKNEKPIESKQATIKSDNFSDDERIEPNDETGDSRTNPKLGDNDLP